jgi:uncharacterized protein
MADSEAATQRAWQRMLSGRRLDLLEPSPLDIEIEDIAHGLARVARWNGQTSGPHAFSVAQHCLAVLSIFDRFWPDATQPQRMTVLLHDAPEYVIGDMISPFKAIVGGGYKDVEARLQAAIHLRFGLPAITPGGLKDRIKRADLIAAFYEAILLAGFAEKEAVEFFGRPRGITPDVANFTPDLSSIAQANFIKAFAAIETARGRA